MSNKKTPKVVPLKQDEEVKFTAFVCVNLMELVLRTKNSGLSPDAFVKYLEFTDAITDGNARYKRDMEALMKSYGVETIRLNPMTGQTRYDFDKHPKRDEIIDKVAAINNMVVPCKALNFMEPKELYEFTKGFTMQEVQNLSTWLKIKKK